MRRTRMIFTLLFLTALPLEVHADMVWHSAYQNPMSNWSAYMYDQNVKRHLRERAAKPAGPSSSAATTSTTTPASPRAPISATDFPRDPNGKDVVVQFIAATNLSPADSTKLATALRSTMAQLGSAGRKDNVATAMTLLLGLSYGVLEKPGFDPNRADDLIPAVNDTLAASPQFKSLGAADRQNMYDSMLLSAAVIAMVHQSGDKVSSKTIAKQTLQQILGPSGAEF